MKEDSLVGGGQTQISKPNMVYNYGLASRGDLSPAVYFVM